MSKIDVHAHIVPPAFRQALEDFGGDPAGWYIPEWTPEEAIRVQNELRIKTSVLSVTSPGCLFLDAEGNRKLARECNAYSAQVKKDHPGRFGFYASLPNPHADLEGSLLELRYALDTLKADGVCLHTQYDGYYLGHTSYEPLWEELNSRRIPVIVHPTPPRDWKPMPGQQYCPCPAFDFPHETTKVVNDLVMSGRRSQYSDVNIVLCHGGGTLPYIADRIAFTTNSPALRNPLSPEEIIKLYKTFHYDTALVGTSPAFESLRSFAPADKLVIGTDHPYAVPFGMRAFSQAVDESLAGATPEDRRDIYEGNAKNVFKDL